MGGRRESWRKGILKGGMESDREGVSLIGRERVLEEGSPGSRESFKESWREERSPGGREKGIPGRRDCWRKSKREGVLEGRSPGMR